MLPLTQKTGASTTEIIQFICGLFARILCQDFENLFAWTGAPSSAFKTIEITEERIVEPRGDNLLQFAISEPQ